LSLIVGQSAWRRFAGYDEHDGARAVTPPNGFVSHPTSVDVPICNATVSSVD